MLGGLVTMDQRMLRRIFLALVLAGAGAIAVFWWLTIPAVIPAAALPAYTANAANGQAVFNAGGCSSCHAVPAQPERTRLGGGLAIPSPFGTFYAPNISPDPADGIGRWSEADFVTAGAGGAAPPRPPFFSGISLPPLPPWEALGGGGPFAFFKNPP